LRNTKQPSDGSNGCIANRLIVEQKLAGQWLAASATKYQGIKINSASLTFGKLGFPFVTPYSVLFLHSKWHVAPSGSGIVSQKQY
jgi:hypothetical protein